MSPPRLALFASVAAASFLWAAFALYACYVQFDHRLMIAEIRDVNSAPEPDEVDDGIATDQQALHALPCSAGLYQDLLLLLAQKSDSASDLDAQDVTLGQTQQALASLLACTPMDGKAWLDFAIINSYREGFTPRSLAAYKMSARVNPGESWLALKRLSFALKFRPLFDVQARQLARQDIDTLLRGHPMRLNAILAEAQVKSSDALYALFMPAAQ